MQVTSKTKYSEFMQYEYAVTPESVRVLMEQAEQYFVRCNELTIEQFFGIVDGNYEILGDVSDPTVLQAFWIKRFAEYCEQFGKACERMTLKSQEDETKLQSGCVQLSPLESMLIFTRAYFGLRSFDEAAQRTLGEYLTARKDRYNAACVQRNYENIQRQKLKKK